MQYRRARTKGGTYFFTVVTYKRKAILANTENVSLLREAFSHVMERHHFTIDVSHVMERHHFTIDAFVLLSDHLHCMWTMPEGDRNFSKRWRLIKSYFSRKCDARYKNTPSPSRQNKKEQAVWQRRFWEHLIRDEQDFVKHVEYIHYNPVRHGLVKAPKYWEYSSFHRYVHNGLYDLEWGAGQGQDMSFDEMIGKE